MVTRLSVLDLFSGIGGFSVGLEKTGYFKTVAFCESDKFCQRVLERHWPGVPIFSCVKRIKNERLKSIGIVPDVITGGFPCQDISAAGKQAGIKAERSGLFSELIRIAGEVRPRYAIFENVSNLLNGQRGDWFKRVLWEISQIGYDAEWHCIPAQYVGANHIRDRVWIIAYPNRERLRLEQISVEKFKNTPQPAIDGKKEQMANTSRVGLEKKREREKKDRITASPSGWWQTEPAVGRVVDGVRSRMDKDRLRSLGNAVVPQCVELLGNAVYEHYKNPTA